MNLRYFISSWPWQTVNKDGGFIAYMVRAWDCFYNAWDFTSAIHNAVRWEGVDRHLLCCLTGALAEAMYGCEYILLKKKYSGFSYRHINYPRDIEEQIKAIQTYQFEHRVFFPKNCAQIDAEIHSWTSYKSEYDGREMSQETRRLIMKSARVGLIGNEYGFFLDNGWIYTYRVGDLLARFRIVTAGEKPKLTGFQYCDNLKGIQDLAIAEAMNAMNAN